MRSFNSWVYIGPVATVLVVCFLVYFAFEENVPRSAVLVLSLFCVLLLLVVFASMLQEMRNREIAEKRLRSQFELSRCLADSVSIEDAAPHILQVICQVMGWDFAALHVVDEDAQLLRCLALWSSANVITNSPIQERTAQLSFAIGVGLPGGVWHNKAPSWIDDIGQAINFPRRTVALESGLKSAFAFPIAADGEVLGVAEFYSLRPMRKDDETAAVFSAIGTQIGQFFRRKQFEQRTEENQAQLRAIVDTATDGIITLDQNGQILSANNAAINMFAYQRDEVIGKNVAQFLPPKWSEKYGSAVLSIYIRNSLQRLVGKVTEVNACRKDGTIFPMDLAVSRIPLDNGEIYTGIMRDITYRKQVEKRVSEFYSMVSHELRSPLASIRGSLGLLEGGAASQETFAELVQIARSNCDRLIRLINDILDVKKIEAGKLDIKRKPISPYELACAAVDGLRTVAKQVGVDLVVRVSKDGPAVYGDPDRILQVLTNLLSNAIKFSPERSEIILDTANAINGENFLRILVKDQGPGIPSSELSKLFSKFQQLDSSDSRLNSGTGLGLAISKAIVEEHDGQIGVDNSPGAGAVFWFELPLVLSQQPDESSKSSN